MNKLRTVKDFAGRRLTVTVLAILSIWTVRTARGQEGGPEREIEDGKIRHAPYGATIPADVLKSMWDKILAMPSEPAATSSALLWKSIGPSGFVPNYTPTGLGRYEGRILDLEVNPSIGTRFAAASGGLWGYAFIAPYPMSDQLTSLAVSTFATLPGNTNTIIVGTGEYSVRAGTGIWKTTDAGKSWGSAVMSSVPENVFKIRYDPANPLIVHAATNRGYYRSDDGGATWTLRFGALCTDLGFAQTASGKRIYLPCWSIGLYSSSDGGDNWNPVSSPVLPTTDMGRTAIAVSSVDPAVSASHLYLSVGRSVLWGQLNGLFRSDDGGLTWNNITPLNPFGAGQLFYDNAIAVSPTDYRLVIVGWVKDHRSTDAGQSWTLIDNLDPNNHDNTHDDWHVFRWTDDGQAIYAGNDGGISFSGDKGVTWTSLGNNAPITQFYGIDVGGVDGQTMIGGAQDNGVVTTNDGGTSWIGTQCCDGGSPSIDPSNSARAYSIMNTARYRSTDGGYVWANIDNGLGAAGVIRSDGGSITSTPTVYTTVNTDVYCSTDFGSSWTSLTAIAPLPASVADIAVPTTNSSGPQLYAVMGANNAGTRLKFYYLGSWYEVSNGFPPIVGSAQRVARVRVHPVYQNVVYAVMNGVDFYAEGQKVFKSTDRGFNWENITGNMPNIPLHDIAMDPGNDNNLYLGSEMGCFRTSDGGTTWARWNNGMPQANLVTELRTTYIGGILHVIAATYGRSAWIRDATTSDPGKFALYHGALKIPVNGNQHSQDTIGVKNGDVNGFVAGLTVRIDTLIHPSVGELIITLHHGGVDDTLYNRTAPPGVPGSNFLGTQFDDTAPTTISLGMPPFAGTYQPAQPLAQFNNLDPVGPWVLDVFQAAGTDTGTLEGWTLSIQPETPTGVTAEQGTPKEFSIGQNYPNPFNPSTNISYQIPEAVQVRLTVFDIVGRSVAVLVDGWEQPGTYRVRFDGARLASGVYFYRLEAGTYAQTRKLVLLK